MAEKALTAVIPEAARAYRSSREARLSRTFARPLDRVGGGPENKAQQEVEGLGCHQDDRCSAAHLGHRESNGLSP